RASEQASKRASEQASKRASEQASKRASEQASNHKLCFFVDLKKYKSNPKQADFSVTKNAIGLFLCVKINQKEKLP
ncbi:MAG: hypothetical protein FWG64_00830, partial [Firmicutes bacterium]|nr:hypothetical protein [Bacillota bacterium]